MEITLQYFDGCPNWEVLDRRLTEALDGRSDVRVVHQRVETAEDAARLGFHGSPTVLIDGSDHLVEVADDRITGALDHRGLLIGVDRHKRLRALDSGHVLDRS